MSSAKPFGPPVPPIEPTQRAVQRSERWLRVAAPLARLGLRRWFDRVEVVGGEHLAGGARLILMNHCHMLDPLLFTAYAGRPIQFLITEPALFESPAARFLSWCGQVPKRKLDSDTRSMKLLKQWCALGAAVAVFPEGRFSWDGRALPHQPGLLHLAHYLDVPVVTVRQLNGDRVWPAWATHARSTTVRFEIDPPRTFAPGDDVEGYVRERLRIDPQTCPRWPVRGKRLAAGLSRLLRFCPGCGAEGTLRDEGDTLRCEGCRSHWEVGADNLLRGPGDPFDVGEALGRVGRALREQWQGKPRLESTGTVELFDARGTTWKPVAAGRLELRNGALHLPGWTFALSELKAFTLDWGDVVLLRTAKERLALRMKQDSRAVWELALG